MYNEMADQAAAAGPSAEVSPIERALRQANEAEAVLGKQLSLLRERLEPVLQPAIPEPDSPGLATVDRPQGWLAQSLQSHGLAVQRHSQTIGDLIARLDV